MLHDCCKELVRIWNENSETILSLSKVDELINGYEQIKANLEVFISKYYNHWPINK
jgi:hypothetical protein